jgi:hypothetical protein
MSSKKKDTRKNEFAFGYYNTNSEGIINAGPYTGLSVPDAKFLNKGQRSQYSKDINKAEGDEVARRTKEGMSEAGKVLHTAIKIVDPTGITSWGDVKESWDKEGVSWNTALETAGALPMLGKLGKLSKLGKVLKAPKVVGKSLEVINDLDKAKKVLNTVGYVDKVTAGGRKLKRTFNTGSKVFSPEEVSAAKEIVSKYKNVDRAILGTRVLGDVDNITDSYNTIKDLAEKRKTETMKLDKTKLPKLGNGVDTSQKVKKSGFNTTVPEDTTSISSKIDWTSTDKNLEKTRAAREALMRNPEKLNSYSIEEIVNTVNPLSLTEEDLNKLSETMTKGGYKFRPSVKTTESGGKEFGFERKVLGLSQGYNRMLNEGEGGTQRGINYEDGGWEELDAAQYKERESRYAEMKKSGIPIYEPVTETSDVFKQKPKPPELKRGIDTIAFDKKPISDKAVGGAIAGLGMAGDIVNTFDTQEEGKKSVVGSALSGVASGAGAGFAVGGPIGAAIGGGVMGAVGVVGAIMGNDKAEKEKARLRLEAERKEALSHFAPAQNTQANMYEFGTSGANMTKPVEVEKDEVVLRKNALGKFILKADFKGGKSHSKGGEDYVLEQGDIVFPGSKRNLIMKSLKSGNHTKIESERLRLPKDLPAETQKLEGGINYTNQITKPNIPTVPSWLQQPTYQTKVYDTNNDIKEGYIKQEAKPKDKKNTTDWGSLIQYAPSISNVIKGFQTPEKIEREYYKPETVKYKDLSENLRKESNLQAEVDKENATRFSGGSAQVARAGKAMASAARFRRLQGIDAQEQQRADTINSINVGTRNQAKGTNIDLKSKYDELDAMNRAAVDAYFDQGVSDFGRITNQIRRDKAMNKIQDVALSNLETDNYIYDKTTGKRRFKRKGE